MAFSKTWCTCTSSHSHEHYNQTNLSWWWLTRPCKPGPEGCSPPWKVRASPWCSSQCSRGEASPPLPPPPRPPRLTRLGGCLRKWRRLWSRSEGHASARGARGWGSDWLPANVGHTCSCLIGWPGPGCSPLWCRPDFLKPWRRFRRKRNTMWPENNKLGFHLRE